MKKLASLTNKKGFTLIELIIVIAILGIIALIAIPNLAGIRQRSQVSADKRTAEQIGKAVRIWLTDIDAAKATDDTRTLPATWTVYTDSTQFKKLSPDYISDGYNAKSLSSSEHTSYFVCGFESQATAGANNATQKIAVAIGDTAASSSDDVGYIEDVAEPTADVDTQVVGYAGGAAGIAYIEK